MPLRLVLIGPDGTIGTADTINYDVLGQMVLFVRRMHERGVQVAFWTRGDWRIQGDPIADYFTRTSGAPVRLFRVGLGGYPTRQRAGSVDPILAEVGVARHETILVGNRESDFQAGVNNRLLLVRPKWYPHDMDYGFGVDAVGGLARFCELFGLRTHPIYWAVEDGSLRVRTMGPFSTRNPDFATFGYDAKAAAKQGGGERRFWFQLIVSSLYFSGLLHQIDCICPFPGHNPAAPGPAKAGFDAVMTRFAKCFRKPYLPDLIVRHTASVKSQTAAAHEKTFRNQLGSIRLNRFPRRYDNPEPPKKAFDLTGKTVLVVDDFCTHGRSLDSARAYIEAAGGRAVLFAWLKTVNVPFRHMQHDPPLKPYEANTLAAEPAAVEYGNWPHIVDHDAPSEIDALLAAFKAWTWPPSGGA